MLHTCEWVQKLLQYFDVSILCNAPPQGWPREWQKHVGGTRYV